MNFNNPFHYNDNNFYLLDTALQDENLDEIISVISSALGYFFYQCFIETFLTQVFVQGSDDAFCKFIDRESLHKDLSWEKKTILDMAVERGSLKIIVKLLKKGNTRFKKGIEIASRAGYQDVFLFLVPMLLPIDNEAIIRFNLPKEELDLLLSNKVFNSYWDEFNFAWEKRKPIHHIHYAKLVEQANEKTLLSGNKLFKNNIEFWLAAYYGNDSAIIKFLSQGLDVNMQLNVHDFVSCSLKSKKLIDDELSENESVRALRGRLPVKMAQYQQLTPLMIAVASGALLKEDKCKQINYLRCIKTLISHGAQLDIQDIDGYTALHWAVQEEWLEGCEILVHKNADIHISNIYGYSPLKLAITLEKHEVVNILLESKQYKPTKKYPDLELIKAVSNNDYDLVCSIIQSSHTNNCVNHFGDSLLFISMEKGNIDMFDLLIKGGFSTTFPCSSRGDTASLYSIRRNKIEFFEYLFYKDLGLNCIGRAWGESPLIEAVRFQNKHLIDLILTKHPDINYRDRLGLNALDYVDIFDRLVFTQKYLSIGISLINAGVENDR